MYERRGADLARHTALLLVSIGLGSSCFLPPDPPVVEGEPERRELIRGAWDSQGDTAAVPEGMEGDRSRGVRDIAPTEWSAGEVVMAGQWSAQVLPEGSEAMPEVSLTLFDSTLEGDVVGTATYDFPGYACRYALVLESTAGDTLELSQRWGLGPCAEAGRILLEWDANEDLLGDWRRPDGRRWFQVRLTPTPPAEAEIGSERVSQPVTGWLPGQESGGG